MREDPIKELITPLHTDYLYPSEIDFYKNWLSNKAWDKREGFIIVVGGHPLRHTDISRNHQFQKFYNEIAGHENIFYDPEGTTIIPITLVEIAFQYIPELPEKLINAYQEIMGKELQYLDYSPVLQFYKKWSQYPLWTTEEAICLVNGISPDIQHCRTSGERESTDWRFPFVKEKHQSVEHLVKRCISAKTLKIDKFDHRSQSYTLSPIVFLEWAKERDGITPHPLLTKLVRDHNIPSEKASLPESTYTTPYLELMKRAIQVHNITAENQGKAESLSQWFQEQSTAHLPISQRKAELMATFIRQPSSEKGGQPKRKNSRR